MDEGERVKPYIFICLMTSMLLVNACSDNRALSRYFYSGHKVVTFADINQEVPPQKRPAMAQSETEQKSVLDPGPAVVDHDGVTAGLSNAQKIKYHLDAIMALTTASKSPEVQAHLNTITSIASQESIASEPEPETSSPVSTKVINKEKITAKFSALKNSVAKAYASSKQKIGSKIHAIKTTAVAAYNKGKEKSKASLLKEVEGGSIVAVNEVDNRASSSDDGKDIPLEVLVGSWGYPEESLPFEIIDTPLMLKAMPMIVATTEAEVMPEPYSHVIKNATVEASKSASATVANLGNESTQAKKVVRTLMAQYKEWKGTHYQLGGTSKRGIDCSGFVQKTFASRFNIILPRDTSSQAKIGTSIKKNQLQAGDLVFFKTGANVRHVGVYVSNNQFLHASTKKGVKLSGLDNVYWKKAYWMAKRIPLK